MKLVFYASLLFSTSAFAVSDQEIIKACWNLGVERMHDLAQELNCSLGPIRVENVRNHFWSSTKYLYLMSPSACADGYYTVRIRSTYKDGECS